MGINILMRQIRIARAEECEICGPNLRAAETLKFDGAVGARRGGGRWRRTERRKEMPW
jgi:hypothetical protein